MSLVIRGFVICIFFNYPRLLNCFRGHFTLLCSYFDQFSRQKENYRLQQKYLVICGFASYSIYLEHSPPQITRASSIGFQRQKANRVELRHKKLFVRKETSKDFFQRKQPSFLSLCCLPIRLDIIELKQKSGFLSLKVHFQKFKTFKSRIFKPKSVKY